MQVSIAIILGVLLVWTGDAHALSNQEKLQQIERQQHQAEVVSEELKEEIDALVSEQRELKGDLADLAKALQKKEQRLAKITHEEAQATEQLQAAMAALDARRGELEAMIQAAVRMSQVPPEAMVMMPEMNDTTMQTARTMRIMADTLSQRARALRAEITKLQEIRSEVHELREQAQTQLSRVKKQRKQVGGKLAKRKKLAKKLRKKLGQESSRLQVLAKQAKDVRQLMASIRRQHKQRETQRVKGGLRDVVDYVESAIRGGGSRGKVRSFTRRKGKLRAPSAGKVVGRFHSKGQGERSKGLTIQTVNNASVNAPFDGKVAYVGSFRGYGNMVILKHAQDYYTLMAGLKDIHASEGEVLLEGEPIGAMGRGNLSKLYVELRQGSEPINPKGWFAGL